MRAIHIVSRLVRVILWTVMTIVLLAAGLLLTLYSQWGQNLIKNSLLTALNRGGETTVAIDEFRLSWPVKLDLTGVLFIQQGDTMIKADTLKADIGLMPLLIGEVSVNEAKLINGYYQLGNADSLMHLQISAGEVLLNPASVKLGKAMNIDLEDGTLRHATVDLRLRTDSVSTDTTPPSEQSMLIRLHKLRVEDLTYKMSMLPTIDSLGTNIASGALSQGLIDLKAQQVRLHKFVADSLTAAYIAPDSATIASYPVIPTDTTSTSAPWTITIDTLRINRSTALYTTQGYKPLPGFDPSYISATDLDLTITDFYNQASTLRLPMKLHATERSGVTLDATGTFALDSIAMHIEDFNIQSTDTYLSLDGMMGMGDMLTDPNLPLALKAYGYCGLGVIGKMFPGYSPYLNLLPRQGRIDLDLDLAGTPSALNIDQLMLALHGCANLHGNGKLYNVFDPSKIGGDISMTGHIINVNSIIKGLTEGDLGIVVPPMDLAARMHILSGNMDGKLTATTMGGRLALDASLNTNTDGYKINVDADKFPLHAFMPDLGIGNATLSIKAEGQGFDMLNPNTHIDAHAHVASLIYSGYNYHDITADAKLNNGDASINANIDNGPIVCSITANGNLNGDTYAWTAKIDGDMINMQELHLSETPMLMTAQISADATYTPRTGEIFADLLIPELYYKGDEATEFTISDVSAKFVSRDSLTQITLHNRDLSAHASMPMYISNISTSFDSVLIVMDQQIKDRKVNVDNLQRVLPKFVIGISAGDDNLINDILRSQQMSIGHLALSASNDSVLSMHSSIFEFVTGSVTLDTIGFGLTQQGDKMHLLANVNNKPGNMDNWAHINVDGMLNTDRLSIRLTQQDVKKTTGFDLGAIAVLADSAVTARLFPLNPMIGYKKWSVNLDNFIYYNFYTHHIDANLKMKGADSSLQLYTEHDHSHHDEHTDSINDIKLRISDVHLQDWISFNPFAPPISGNLSADMNLLWDGGTDINGNGNIVLEDFYYDKRKVSSLQVDLDVKTNTSGTVRAQADLMVDGERTMVLSGILNDKDSDTPFSLDFSVIKFPLATVNPFLPEDFAQLSGTLNGKMDVSGNSDHPILNGEINFDNAYVKMAMTNTSYALSPVKIPVVNNLVSFTDFNITGANENPLYINGTVDISSMVSPKINLKLNAQNMMVVNTQRPARNAMVYGKAYLDLKASVNGNLNFMDIDADVTVLSGTNVSYVLTESTDDLMGNDLEGLVKFVNLSDTTAVAAADSIANESMLMMLDAQLNIQSGTTITVDLPTGSRDKVQIQPTGYLTYTQAPMSDPRVTGRIDINNGFVRYSLPVVGSEKNFTFDNSSYVAFNGDMLNPVLNIHATDQVKANVNQEGQNSRMVNFNIIVSVTGTLDRMDVAFDLSTDDDLTVANELQTMSAEQRANQAMNMLLYNMYTGPGTTTTANNPLFSFLESQINNWAANNIKGVDLSFGIDQYNQTTNGYTSSAMSYSYQVSKTLFNDRFKIVVGGNYSTDSNADENLAENLINDISFEYYLNKQQTMLIRIFRHVGYESILEGEVTQTGVGFMYRKKLDRLGRMLPKFMRPHYND